MNSAGKKITVEMCKDSGLALVLICLLCYLAWERPYLLVLAIGFLIIAMTWPRAFWPFARFWFSLTTALGTVVSKVILTVLFYGLVFPVGLARRALGKDAMQVKAWKKGQASVFRSRNHRFSAQDLEHPY
jgi:hypothetical protein